MKDNFKTLFQTSIKDKNGNDVNALWYLLKDNTNDKIIGNVALLKSLFNDTGKNYDDTKYFIDDEAKKIYFVNNIVNSTNSSLYSFIKIQGDI